MGPGDIIDDRFELLATAGSGGMGTVYRAFDRTLERDVALKVMKPGLPAQARRCFRAEALYGARLCHPSLVRIFDLGILPDRGLEWFAMESSTRSRTRTARA